jgi:hypothetical protein
VPRITNSRIPIVTDGATPHNSAEEALYLARRWDLAAARVDAAAGKFGAAWRVQVLEAELRLFDDDERERAS